MNVMAKVGQIWNILKNRVIPYLPGVWAKSAIEVTAKEASTALEWPKSIEIAGKRILAMPLEAMPLTEVQKLKFLDAGGIIMDMTKISKKEAIRIANESPWAMLEWQESFEDLSWTMRKYSTNPFEGDGPGRSYTGYSLFKIVYQTFPGFRSMSKKQATIAWLYPTIHYRNLAARRWFAEMSGGRLAADYEILEIYRAIRGESNAERLALMGQAPLGYREWASWYISGLGSSAELGGWLFDQSGMVSGIGVERYAPGVSEESYRSMDATSGVVIMRDE